MKLREFFDAEYERLATYLSRHSDPETGEDLASEAFARLAAREVASVDLLWRVGLNALTDWQRNRSTRPDILTNHDGVLDFHHELDRSPRSIAFTTLDHSLFRADFDRAFRALPRPLAEAFTLTELRGLTARDAAAVLSLSQPTVTRRAVLARALLKGALS